MNRRFVALVFLFAAGRLAAQEASYDSAFDLERRGSYAAAAEAYRQVLRRTPGDVNSLLGLERVLHELGRAEAMGPEAAAALVADSTNPVLYAAAVRAWTAASQGDSVRRLVARWARIEPGSEAPYREWGFAALGRRDRAAARQAYLIGREQLHRGDALAGELAQLATVDGDYATAVTEWLHALHAIPGYRASAVGMLSQVPAERHSFVLGLLERRGDLLALGLAAALSARWGDPLTGCQLLGTAPKGDSTVVALQGFLEELRSLGGQDAALARARTLEAIAGMASRGTAQWLADAARAYAEAGDQAAARRMLAQLAGQGAASPELAAMAGATLVSVLVAERQLEEADRRLTDLGTAIGADERERLTHLLTRGLLRAGRLDRAEALLGADSTVEGFALRGRARLYRGDLAGAARELGAAGPYALDRADATERAELLALLQVMDADSLPALGRAFQLLDRGDSVEAVKGIEAVARTLQPERGGAELLLLAGRVEAARAQGAEAEGYFRGALRARESAAAAAAGLELASLLIRQGRQGEAIAALEQVILDHPASAAAPRARRLLDVVRGGVPQG